MNKILPYIMFAPFATYFLTMFWALMFGDTFYKEENDMYTEWLITIPIYAILTILHLTMKRNKNE